MHLLDKEYRLILQGYRDNISSLLIQDFDQLLNSETEIENKSFFLLKSLGIELIDSDKQFSSKPYDIKIKSFAIYVENLKHRFIIDLQQIKEALSTIFPEFIDYQVIIDGNNIANNSASIRAFITSKEYKLLDNISMVMNFGIKKDSDFYIKSSKHLLMKWSLTAFFSTIIVFLILYFYLKRKAENDYRLYILEEHLTTIDKERKALLSRDEIYSQLNKSFIKKATEIYIEEITGGRGEAGNYVNTSSNDYIFPIPLNDSSYSNIDIQRLVLMLKKYFLPYAGNIVLKAETSVNTINIHCASEVFYQLIFSLIYNLIELMERQNEQLKLMKIKFSDKDLVVEYDSFPIDEERMIYLSDSIIEGRMDAFFLSCRKLFKSLIDHKFTYIIKSSENSQNTIEVVYPEKNLSTQPQENKILDFYAYYKK